MSFGASSRQGCGYTAHGRASEIFDGREVDEKGFYHAASFATQFRVGALAPLGFVESSPNLQALLIPLLSMCVQNMSSKNAKLEISQKSRVSEHVAGATRFCKK